MATSRTYGEACGIPRALDRVGERWALLVVRELMLGPKRFTDLKTGLPHASPNVLAQRLRELEQAGVVRKRRLPPPAASQVYELTDWGRELEPVLVALGRWGARAPLDPECMGMSVDSHVVSLATLFDPERAGDFEASLELRMGEDVFRAVDRRTARSTRGHGAPPSPDAVLTLDPGTLLALIHGEISVARRASPPARSRSTATAQAVERFVGAVPAAGAGGAARVAPRLRDRDVRREVDVLDGVEDLDALGHRPLERLAARDQAGAARALVDHRRADGLGLVGVLGGRAARVDQARAAHVAARHLVAAEVDRVVGRELVVDEVVGLAEAERR